MKIYSSFKITEKQFLDGLLIQRVNAYIEITIFCKIPSQIVEGIVDKAKDEFINVKKGQS